MFCLWPHAIDNQEGAFSKVSDGLEVLTPKHRRQQTELFILYMVIRNYSKQRSSKHYCSSGPTCISLDMAEVVSPHGSVPRELYLIGVGTGHSVAPPMHNYIAKSLQLPWTFQVKECSTIEECMKLLRSDVCAGASITMPYKSTVMGQLDEVDELTTTLAACNTVCVAADGRLSGTNVDWCGIAGSLSEFSLGLRLPSTRTALVIGAGGAARAAVYALSAKMGCRDIYVLNRDEQEVVDLQRDVNQRYVSRPHIIHVNSIHQTEALQTPTYIVGTVPDIPPITPDEKNLKMIFEVFLQRPTKGLVLDMCYKPRQTRHLKLARAFGWRTIEGIHVVGHQAEQQWRAWVGDERVREIDRKGMWKALQKSADESPIVSGQKG